MQAPPQVLAQQRRNRHRSRAQLRPGATALAPHDRLLVVGAEAGVEREPQALGTAGDHVALLPHAAQLRGQAAQCVAHAGRLARRQVAQLGLAQPRAPARRRQAREERLGCALELVQQAGGRGRVVEPAGALAVAPELRDVAQREARAQPFGSRVLQLVRLVEDDRVVLREHADRPVRGDAQAEIGEVERVIDDHHVGVARTLARLLCEAGRRVRAARAQAALRADGDLRPGARGRFVIELGAVSGQRRVEPRTQAFEGLAVHGIEQAHAELHDHPPAGVVGAALEQLRADGLAARRRRQRQVVAQELRLQRERGRRDHHAAPGEGGRDEIAEALAGAGAGLAQERPSPRQDLLDALRRARAAPAARDTPDVRVRAARPPQTAARARAQCTRRVTRIRAPRCPTRTGSARLLGTGG